jgi:hypothetical protein
MKNTLAWLRRNCDTFEYTDEESFYGKYLGHQVRLTSDKILQIGNIDFDRWANSVAFEVTLDETKSIPCQVNLAVMEAKKDTSPYWERSLAVMKKLKEAK